MDTKLIAEIILFSLIPFITIIFGGVFQILKYQKN